MLADVARADRTEQRIRDRVRENVCVGMTFQSAWVRDLHAAKNQFSPFDEAVNVVADAGANHNEEWGMTNDE